MTATRWLALGVAAAGLASFAIVLESGALWHASVSFGAGQLSSGNLVLLTGDSTTQVKNYGFHALSGSGLTPGNWSQAPLTVKNGGSALLSYRLSNTSAVAGGGLPGQLRLVMSMVQTTSNCPTGQAAADPTGTVSIIYDGNLVGASWAGVRALNSGVSDALCVRIVLPASAGTSAEGATTEITFTFSADST
jgi:hypothetical protein